MISINPESSVLERSLDVAVSGLPAISHTLSLQLKSGLLTMSVSREHSSPRTARQYSTAGVTSSGPTLRILFEKEKY